MKFEHKGNSLKIHLDKKHMAFAARLGQLPHKPANNHKVSRENLFSIAGLNANQEHCFFLKNNILTVNVHKSQAEEAEFFFKTLFNQSYSKNEKQEPFSHAWLQKIASKSRSALDKKKKEDRKQEITDNVVGFSEYTESFRYTTNNLSKKLLNIIDNSGYLRDRLIFALGLTDPTSQEKTKAANRAKSKKDGDPDKKKLGNISRIDVIGGTLEYNATTANQKKIKYFFPLLDKWVQDYEFTEANFEDVIWDHISKAEELCDIQQKSGTSVYNTNASANLNKDPKQHIFIDWTAALGEKFAEKDLKESKDPDKFFKKNFNVTKEGHHIVLRADSTHAQCLWDAFKPYEDYFADTLLNDPSFKITLDDKKRKTIRISTKTELFEPKYRYLKMFFEGLIRHKTPDLKRANLTSDFRKQTVKAEQKLIEQAEKAKEDLQEVEEKMVILEEKTLTFRSKEEKAFIPKLEKRLEDIKKFMNLDAVSLKNQSIVIGGKSKDFVTQKEKNLKAFIRWLASGPKEVDIETGDIPKLFIRFENETKEQRYERIHIEEYNRGFNMLNAEQKDALSKLDTKDIIYLVGQAGTGKTFLAILKGLHDLHDDQSPIKKIIISRPTVTAGGKDTGYLPGGINEKWAPYMDGYIDNLNIITGSEGEVEKLMNEHREEGDNKTIKPVIEFQPIEYIRGRSISNAIVIVDEAQNATRQDLSLIRRRLGKDAKLVLCGDITGDQCDLPPNDQGGFKELAIREAFAQEKNLITKASDGKTNAFSISGVTQLVQVVRSKTVDCVIHADKYFQDNKDSLKDELETFEKSFIKKSYVTLKS